MSQTTTTPSSLIQGQGNSVGSWDENLYSSVAIIVGSVILAIAFGNVAMLVSNFNANTTNYHRKMEAVYATMDKMDLPLKLRERVKEYYTHVWLEYEALDGELTHTLRIEIGLYKFMNLVVKIPFWEDCTPDFLTQIVLNLGVRVYMPDDYVVRRREIGSEMMLINLGYCILSKPIKRAKKAKILEMAIYTGGANDGTRPILSPECIEKGSDLDAAEDSDHEEDSQDSSSDESPREWTICLPRTCDAYLDLRLSFKDWTLQTTATMSDPAMFSLTPKTQNGTSSAFILSLAKHLAR
ncbi:unnamed protein product [Phytophthora lilii]|uniref:Unnamed protein product n=1 Tax=Phytophthora lilii TaxID=2077276 RepID=A0A9W6UBC2_9STRA|nr:unnamed protein product [Phytophthora lilii]